MLFSGGRGSGALTRQLIASPAIDLTVAINGYDDGASTGEVRRFLGDSLGPSDFRKNASTIAGALRTCPPALIESARSPLPARLRDIRRPVCDRRRGRRIGAPASAMRSSIPWRGSSSALEYSRRAHLGARLLRFRDEVRSSGRTFDFSDCSLGNLVFAGVLSPGGRHFNQAVDDYCGLVGSAGRAPRERHRRDQRVPRRDRRRRPAARDRGSDRRRRQAEPDPRDLPDRSTADRRTSARSSAPAVTARRRCFANGRRRSPINPRLAPKIAAPI